MPLSRLGRLLASSSRTVLALLAVSLLVPGAARAASFTLPDDSWQLLVLPGESGGRNVTTLFGGTLPMADYTSTWTIFVPDETGTGYVEPAAGAALATGQAFWMIQRTGADIVLDVTLNAPDGTLDPGCTSSAGCLTLPVNAQANATVWNAFGVPLDRETAVAALRLVTSGGACRDGCDLDQAAAAGLTAGTIWSQLDTRGGYRELGNDDTLAPWEGFWIPLQTGATLMGTVEIVLPLGEPDLIYCT